MKEILELRVVNEFANLVFPDNAGKTVGSGTVRKIKFPPNDVLMAKIKKVNKELNKTRNDSLFYGWSYHRTYSNEELKKAEIFHLMITAFFEPEATYCGSIYDYSNVCVHCGVGRQLIGDLILDLSKVPKNKDFAQTIARDEWIVSENLMKLMQDNDIKGVTFNKVTSKNKRLNSVLNWYQLKITSPVVETTFPTRYGIDPIDDDSQGLYRCPLGHIEGLNLLSELSIKKDTYNQLYDIAITRQHVGRHENVLNPAPLIVISSRLRELLISHNIKGFKTEVAYLTE